MPAITIAGEQYAGYPQVRTHAHNVLDAHTFPTVQGKRDKRQHVAKRVPLRAEHVAFFRELIEQHYPHYERCIEPYRVDRFEVRRPDREKMHNKLFVQCTDEHALWGARTFHVCVEVNAFFTNPDKRHLEHLYEAMEEAVREQFEEFYRCCAVTEIRCAETNVLLPDRQSTVVAYRDGLTLRVLVAMYEHDRGFDISVLPIENLFGKNVRPGLWMIMDDELKEDWQHFHNEHATYRFISKAQQQREEQQAKKDEQKAVAKKKKKKKKRKRGDGGSGEEDEEAE